MNDYDMYQNDGYGNEYQPVIDRLREIAARGVKMENGSTDPDRLRRHEPAGGQMMDREMPDSMQQLMSNPKLMRQVMDWLNKSGMMEEPMQSPQSATSIPGMQPPQSFEDGSTPFTRLQERINNIGRGNACRNGNDCY